MLGHMTVAADIEMSWCKNFIQGLLRACQQRPKLRERFGAHPGQVVGRHPRAQHEIAGQSRIDAMVERPVVGLQNDQAFWGLKTAHRRIPNRYSRSTSMAWSTDKPS